MFALQSPGPIIAVRTDIRGDGLLWGCLAAFAYARFPRFQIPRFVFVASVILAPILFSLFAALCVFPVLVAAAVLATVQHPGWTVSSLLEWRPLVWIGERSYGIYIWQQILIAYGHLEMPFWASMALRIVATLVLAEISYVLLENPLRRIGQRMAANLRSQPLRGSVAGATEPGV
jgi:peptidoglycan/LPS O-acetylase OafA/YrhL